MGILKHLTFLLRNLYGGKEATVRTKHGTADWFTTGKDPEAGKDCRQEEKGITEDEMVGWHHQLNGHEFEQALGVGDG